MNIRKVKWRVQKELDRALNDNHTLFVKREPVLPMEGKDRTEWLLWCTHKRNCTMDEANRIYRINIGNMKRFAANIRRRRKLDI